MLVVVNRFVLSIDYIVVLRLVLTIAVRGRTLLLFCGCLLIYFAEYLVRYLGKLIASGLYCSCIRTCRRILDGFNLGLNLGLIVSGYLVAQFTH